MQPELSSLDIFTAVMGFRPLKRTLLEWDHRYTQSQTFGKLRSSALNALPEGNNAHLRDKECKNPHPKQDTSHLVKHL